MHSKVVACFDTLTIIFYKKRKYPGKNALGIFEMGKYHEYSPMLDVVCAEKNVAGTYQVAEQLLKGVDSLCDCQKSRLFQHMKFSEPNSSFAEGLKEKLLDGFRDEESFGYMRGNKAWEEMINDKTH